MKILTVKDAKYGFVRPMDHSHAEPVAVPGRGCPPFQRSEALRNFGSIDITASTALNFPKD